MTFWLDAGRATGLSGSRRRKPEASSHHSRTATIICARSPYRGRGYERILRAPRFRRACIATPAAVRCRIPDVRPWRLGPAIRTRPTAEARIRMADRIERAVLSGRRNRLLVAARDDLGA